MQKRTFGGCNSRRRQLKTFDFQPEISCQEGINDQITIQSSRSPGVRGIILCPYDRLQ
jgi:hypothetical protein